MRGWNMKNMLVVAVSGGFDPIHIGHIRYIKVARQLGDRLIVILNTDDQLIRKKGYCFMPYAARKESLEAIQGVDVVVPNIDSDITCNESIEYYRPNILAKGGDRIEANMPDIEKAACASLGCEIVYGVGGGKIQSSSSLVTKSIGLHKKEVVLADV
jgi:D-beta-D-heptose 7-phosphate kinase/D-beta-D-heptose 1-phosphate adenosyltransferase